MRDIVAWLAVLFLLVVAASLATTLKFYRRRRMRARQSEEALGRRIIAELPTSDELVHFTEDEVRFHYGETSIDKDLSMVRRSPRFSRRAMATISRRLPRSKTGLKASHEIAGT
jgi:hypothetical protein